MEPRTKLMLEAMEQEIREQERQTGKPPWHLIELYNTKCAKHRVEPKKQTV